MAKASFNGKQMVESAEAGELSPVQVRQAIKRASDLGLYDIARKLSEHLVQANEIAKDNAPDELQKRVAKGISLLKGLGYHPNRTIQMLGRKGVIATLNHIGTHTAISPNMKRMIAAGYYKYTTEAIILDYPQLFTKEAVEASKIKLEGFKKPS